MRVLGWAVGIGAAVCLAVLPQPAASAAPGAAGAPPGIDEPLCATPGDAGRGRAIVADRRVGLCLLCHGAPIAEPGPQGNLAPSLAGVGSRRTAAELRLRLVDSRRVQPDSLMPAYYRSDGLTRVGRAWVGRTLLDAQQIEDVLAYLVTLKD